MMDYGSSFSPAPFLLFGAIVLAIVYFKTLAERKRHERNRRYAQRMGWEYHAHDPSLVGFFASRPFGRGRSRRASDVMRGAVREREFLVFGYRFVTGSGKNRQEHFYRICVIRIPGRLPIVRFNPENPATRIMTALGETDVEVESEDFNRRWRVWSRDERAAHALLTPRMIERFLKPDLTWKSVVFEPGFVMISARGKLDLPSTALPFDTLCDIADLVPGFLAQDYP